MLEAVPSETVDPLTVPQFVPVIDVPVQNTKDSSTDKFIDIAVAVLAATVPVSTGVAQPVSENRVILA